RNALAAHAKAGGAAYRPYHLDGDAGQHHRIASGLRPVLYHDGGPAGKSHGDVGLLYLPQLVSLPQTRLWIGAVTRSCRAGSVLHAASACDQQEGRMKRKTGTKGFLAAALCMAVAAIFMAPLLVTALASVKSKLEAA